MVGFRDDTVKTIFLSAPAVPVTYGNGGGGGGGGGVVWCGVVWCGSRIVDMRKG